MALGTVIDDSVIDVESILARLRDAEARHASRAEAVLAAAMEVRAPVVYASMALIIAVAPLLVLPGAEGALLHPLGAAIIFSTTASMFIAAAVTPGLAWLFLRHIGHAPEPRAWSRLKAGHAALLGRLARARVAVLVAALVVAAAAGLALALDYHTEFLPRFHDSHLVATIDAPPSTSLEAMRDYGLRIGADIRAVGGVTAVAETIGRDDTGDQSWGLEHSQFDVALQPGLAAARQEAIAEEISRRLARYPGLHAAVETRFEATQPEARTGFAVSVFGPDPATIDAAAGQAARAVAAAPGARDVHTDDLAQAPAVRIDLNFPRLALFGLSSTDVLDTVQAAFEGERVARIYQDGRVVDVAVSAQASLRRDPEAVGGLLLRSTSGVSVPLSRVANVYLTSARAVIAHDNGLLRQQVLASPDPGDAVRFDRAAMQAIAQRAHLPPGAFVEYQGGDTARLDMRRALQIDYGLAITAVLAILAVILDGMTVALIVISVLFSLVGGAVAVVLMGGMLSVGAFAGFVALAGIAMRSAILLIDRVEGLVVARQASWSLETVLRATGERVTPVVMTTLLVALALAPLAVHAGAAGREVLGPMALVVMGGLVTGAVGSLVLLPLMVHWFWRPRFGRRSRHRPFARGSASSPGSPG